MQRPGGAAVGAHEVRGDGIGGVAELVEVSAGAPAGERIEHGALVPAALIDELARRRLPVITQPGFLADRDAADLPDLYRCASLPGPRPISSCCAHRRTTCPPPQPIRCAPH